MGVDAVMLAEKAKRSFFFGRSLNFLEVLWGRDRDKFMDPEHGASAKDVISQAEKNIVYWTEIGGVDRVRAEWNREIIAFVRAHPDDTFRVLTDMVDEYYDVIDAGVERWSPLMEGS